MILRSVHAIDSVLHSFEPEVMAYEVPEYGVLIQSAEARCKALTLAANRAACLRCFDLLNAKPWEIHLGENI